VDLSYVPQAEAMGTKFYRRAGGPADSAIEIVRANGANIARLRIWNDPLFPNQTYASPANVLKLAKRVHEAEMLVHLDFMYSDTWADPGHQWMPAAWTGLAFEKLTQRLYNFTHTVLTEAAAQGIPIEIVQVGNEITNGMVWARTDCKKGGGTWQPDGADCGGDNAKDADSNWPHLIALVNGKKAMRSQFFAVLRPQKDRF
jgi:arabinogalactan endo-1,4-beta-galactosidase